MGNSGVPEISALLVGAATEVDQSLLDWYQELTITERLRAASRNAAILERLACAALADEPRRS
jgi:hypothetical protein